MTRLAILNEQHSQSAALSAQKACFGSGTSSVLGVRDRLMDAATRRSLSHATGEPFADALDSAEALLCGSALSASDYRTVIAVLSRRLRAGDDTKVCSSILGCLSRSLSSPSGVTAAREVLGALEPAVGLVSQRRLRSPVARFVTALVVQAGTIDVTASVLFSKGLDSHEVRRFLPCSHPTRSPAPACPAVRARDKELDSIHTARAAPSSR